MNSNFELPAYPAAAAHKTTSKGVVAQQPQPASSMVISSDVKSQKRPDQEEAMRLRGGCIPCPDGGCCYIIPLPCCCC